ncbi:Homeobox-leucine zipper family protein / lipid-binding START domain-containing protein [Trifolium repens]|nr:Homeobox-leucine zipper family protein / lipid-binding START domain-containing protein [Trifolium repens]
MAQRPNIPGQFVYQMDKSWISNNPVTNEDYIREISSFLNFAFANSSENGNFFRPCIKCANNVPPALLVRFFREHQSECSDYGFDAYPAACLKSSPYAVPCARPGGFPSSQVILPLAPMVKHEEFLEVVRIERHAFSLEDIALACDIGIDESSIGACAQLVFAPIDKSFADDALWVPYGFRVIPLDPESANDIACIQDGRGCD